MSKEKLIKHWEEDSDKNFNEMLTMFDSKHYPWALFVGHLSLEKLLKAIYAERNPKQPEAPRIHNLVALAEKCNLELDDEKAYLLGVIYTFCMEARYPDIKQDFYKRCTKEYAEMHVKNIKELRSWLKTELIKKS